MRCYRYSTDCEKHSMKMDGNGIEAVVIQIIAKDPRMMKGRKKKMAHMGDEDVNMEHFGHMSNHFDVCPKMMEPIHMMMEQMGDDRVDLQKQVFVQIDRALGLLKQGMMAGEMSESNLDHLLTHFEKAVDALEQMDAKLLPAFDIIDDEVGKAIELAGGEMSFGDRIDELDAKTPEEE
jgi:hypothetical protein